MEVKGCSSYVTVVSLATTSFSYPVPLTPVAAMFTLFTGSTYFSTTDGTNCAMTITMHLTSNNAAYSGSFLGVDSAGTV